MTDELNDGIVQLLNGKQAVDVKTIYATLAPEDTHISTSYERDDVYESLNDLHWNNVIRSKTFDGYTLTGLSHQYLKDQLLYRQDRDMQEKIDWLSKTASISKRTTIDLAEQYYEELVFWACAPQYRPHIITSLDHFSKPIRRLEKDIDGLASGTARQELHKLKDTGLAVPNTEVNKQNQRTTRWSLTTLGGSIAKFTQHTHTFEQKYFPLNAVLGLTTEDMFGRCRSYKVGKILYAAKKLRGPSAADLMRAGGILTERTDSREIVDELERKGFLGKRATTRPVHYDKHLKHIELVEDSGNRLTQQLTYRLDDISSSERPRALEKIACILARDGQATTNKLMNETGYSATTVKNSLVCLRERGKIEREIKEGALTEFWLEEPGIIAVEEFIDPVLREVPEEFRTRMDIDPLTYKPNRK